MKKDNNTSANLSRDRRWGKRVLILLTLLLATSSLSAQNFARRGFAFGADRDTLLYIIASPFDNWFLTLGGGPQTFIGNELDASARHNKLNWNINYNGYVSYNIQKDEGVDNDFSLSNSIGSSFNYKKHTASMYLSLSNYSDMERIGQRVHTNLDTRFTLSYSYSFAARVIKKKTKQQRAEEKVSRHAKKMQKNAS